MVTNRLRARRIINSLCIANYGVYLEDLPDLPCIMYALDEMEAMIEEEGEQVSIAKLQNIAQDAISELVDDGWLTI